MGNQPGGKNKKFYDDEDAFLFSRFQFEQKKRLQNCKILLFNPTELKQKKQIEREWKEKQRSSKKSKELLYIIT